MKTVFRLTTAIALISATAAFAVSSIQGFALRWTPKEGDTFTLQTTGTFEVNGSEAILKQKATQKVIKVDTDGSYTVQNNTAEGLITASGQEFPTPGSAVVTHFKATGEVIDMTGDPAAASLYRLNNLTNLHRPEKPVNVGDTWTFEAKPDATKGTVAVKGTYKLEGEEKVGDTDALKITGTIKETEGSDGGAIEATYWISKADGSLIKYSAKWTTVTVPGAPLPFPEKWRWFEVAER